MAKQNQVLLLISGPVGVGKTTVANELSTLLVNESVPHTFVDLDALTHTYPRSLSDPFGNALALANLTIIWNNGRNHGARNLIVPRVVETRDYAEHLAQSVGISHPIVCRLTASDRTLLERVRAREIGSNLAWHEKRSLQLSAELSKTRNEDFSIATDGRSITEIATEILQRVKWSR